MLLLACQRVVVQPGSSMMIHGASYGSFGHMSHVKSTVEFSETYLRSIFNRVYKGFLTEEEVEKLLTTDYDLNFTDQQIIERLTKMTEPAEDVVQETKPAPKGRAKPKKETK
jgi:ATP-dependent protease ClpP protease subunit